MVARASHSRANDGYARNMESKTLVGRIAARYKREALPILEALGFKGTVANMTLDVGRARLLAFVSRASDRIQMGVNGSGDRGAFPIANALFLESHAADDADARFDAYVDTLRTSLASQVAELAKDVAPPPPTSLAEAAERLLQWLATDEDFPGVVIESVAVSGRTLIVHVQGRTELQVDRTALMSLVRALRAERPRDPRRHLKYALHGRELYAYLDLIAEEDLDEARALWVHLCSPYDVSKKLFSEPLAIAKELNVAASAGALVARALPYAKGAAKDLVDRIAAINILTMTLGSLGKHRDRDALLTEARSLADSLEEETSPILRDCGWMLRERC